MTCDFQLAGNILYFLNKVLNKAEREIFVGVIQKLPDSNRVNENL